ncbi:UNVERIFIED_CONTAM: hypothetical protein Sangu_3212200 [Sesamum angustifolium]|uniref:Reverse transcriptase domain-containing protein n=1 Tax=Sesamum angustifolium TaxID=2727405 RepID=A0AAW2JM96_9LAMI
MSEFRDCLLDTGLIHLPVQGERFSWHNCSEGDRSLWKRLDRLLVNDSWLSQWPNSHYHCLNARTSDHSPLVIRGDTATHTISMFRFDNYLTMSSDFTPSVQSIWRHRIEGTAMYAVTRKLRALKPVFRTLRKKKGDLTLNVKLAAEFLDTQLLGGERRREFIDLRYLRPWARHVVTPAECLELVQQPTLEEVKDAFFDIAEDKAPGPDGYSSGFYKAAWPVIGEERLRLVLDAMISPSQNAFVPGRSIGDNILLAQEMFAGYNRQGLPKRCALKVDLRKAYDTVEWDFLIAALKMFGFPDLFIGWIEECVTTPMFSLMMQQLIDQNEGFSYHWRCKELGLFQLCFADDLLLFCKADVASVQVFRRGLDEFAKLSGLHANPQKSQLIISRSAQDERDHLIAALQFQEGHLPLRYLGLPLLASRLSISDCQPLLLKVDSRIKGWDSIQFVIRWKASVD